MGYEPYNTAINSGGAGIYNISSSPTVINCILWGNLGTFPVDISNSSSTPTVAFSYVGGPSPAFVVGPYGVYYLNQATSPCVNTGSDTAANLGLDTRTTDPAGSPDSGQVDMGYHYPIP